MYLLSVITGRMETVESMAMPILVVESTDARAYCGLIIISDEDEMKKIGMLGGIGWPSTIEYYRILCELSQAYHADKCFDGPVPMPEMVIESLNMNFTVNQRGSSVSGSWDAWDHYLNKALRRLQAGGAGLIVIASVTPHTRLAEISVGIEVPIVSIYQAVGDYCRAENIDKLLLLGTGPTMSSPAFGQAMQSFAVQAFSPPTDDLKSGIVDIIHRLYRNQLEGAAGDIDNLVRNCLSSENLTTTAVCLGCTELPTAFADDKHLVSFSRKGVCYLNSTVLHARAVFEACVI